MLSFSSLFREDIIYFLKLLVLKEYKVNKEKQQFAQIQVLYLGHLVQDQGPHLDPEKLYGILGIPNPKLSTNHEVFSRQLVIAEIRFQMSLSIMAKSLSVLENNNHLNTTLWENQDSTVSKALKECWMNPPAVGHPNYHIPFFLFVYEKQGSTPKHGSPR